MGQIALEWVAIGHAARAMQQQHWRWSWADLQPCGSSRMRRLVSAVRWQWATSAML